MMTYLTVDPGLNGTGLAYWEVGDHHTTWKSCAPPIETRVLSYGEPDWLIRSSWLCDSFEISLRVHKPDTVWIEYPKLHSTASGMASAQRGDVFKLMFFVGRLADRTYKAGINFVPLPVEVWKGTMSKEAVASRVASRLGCAENAYPNHVMDAVGMGLYLKGVFDATGTTRKRAK